MVTKRDIRGPFDQALRLGAGSAGRARPHVRRTGGDDGEAAGEGGPSPACPPVYDQGQLGSCTGNAIAGAVQFDREKQKLKPDFVPSRLFIYYGERVIEGTVDSDSRCADPRRHQGRRQAGRPAGD